MINQGQDQEGPAMAASLRRSAGRSLPSPQKLSHLSPPVEGADDQEQDGRNPEPPTGNRNAFKHGFYAGTVQSLRRRLAGLSENR
jgi:hypothetical protein